MSFLALSLLQALRLDGVESPRNEFGEAVVAGLVIRFLTNRCAPF
jgi:hypothetical protein